jgi:hypothetical protein
VGLGVTAWDDYLATHRDRPWLRPPAPAVGSELLRLSYVAWMTARDPELHAKDKNAFTEALSAVPWLPNGSTRDKTGHYWTGLTVETREERAEREVMGTPRSVWWREHMREAHYLRQDDGEDCRHEWSPEAVAEQSCARRPARRGAR